MFNKNLSSDINECISPELNTCQQQCLNSPGSFTCGCYTGYQLTVDRQTCSGTV